MVSEYLEPLAAHPALAPIVNYGHRVTKVTRVQPQGKGVGRTRSQGREDSLFLVRIETATGTEDVLGRAVIDASGTWNTPNPVGRSGIEAIGEIEAKVAGFITSPLPDPMGADQDRFVENEDITLLENVSVSSVVVGEQLTVHLADGRLLRLDLVVPATGFRPDLKPLTELRLDLDQIVEAPRALGPLIDSEFHSCGTVTAHGERVLAHPEPNFYVVGMKSCGRAPTFLLATGYEQVRSIAAYLAGDRAAADLVELQLPESGVCSTDLADSCCGTSNPGNIGFATGTLHGHAELVSAQKSCGSA
ncbi:hypothetical protein [Arthrobacter roseus]|uniref:hypothetical protein n=1 Tax=Arthrobacter roseus TaxID=136274 RepID=UPI0030844F32|nr:hypothetical protein [Arthrobacter roseus]